MMSDIDIFFAVIMGTIATVGIFLSIYDGGIG